MDGKKLRGVKQVLPILSVFELFSFSALVDQPPSRLARAGELPVSYARSRHDLSPAE